MATANTADIDGDGDLDLVLGDVKGRVWWAPNEGTKTAPRFAQRLPLNVGNEQVKVNQKSDAVPVDWDGDGVLDLLVGDEVGDVTFFAGRKDRAFEPGLSLFSKLPVDPKLGYEEARKRLEPHRKIPGYRLRLCVADWNDDGKLDLLVGNCVSPPKSGDGEEEQNVFGNVYVLLRE